MNFYSEGGSDKHLRDIASMLKIATEQIDRRYINVWASTLGLDTVWRQILAKVGR